MKTNEQEALKLIKTKLILCNVLFVFIIAFTFFIFAIALHSNEKEFHIVEIFLFFAFGLLTLNTFLMRQTLIKPFSDFKKNKLLSDDIFAGYNKVQLFIYYCISNVLEDTQINRDLVKSKMIRAGLIPEKNASLKKVAFGGPRATAMILYENFIFVCSTSLGTPDPEIIERGDIVEYKIYDTIMCKLKITYRKNKKLKSKRLHSFEYDKWIDWLAAQGVKNASHSSN